MPKTSSSSSSPPPPPPPASGVATATTAPRKSTGGQAPPEPPETIRQQMAQLRPAVAQLDFDMLGLLTQFDGDRLRLLFAFLFPAHVASADLPDHRKGNCYLCTAPIAQFSSDVACTECMHRLFQAIGNHCIVHQSFKQASLVIQRHQSRPPQGSNASGGIGVALTRSTACEIVAFDGVVAQLMGTLPPLEPSLVQQAIDDHRGEGGVALALRHYGFRRGGGGG